MSTFLPRNRSSRYFRICIPLCLRPFFNGRVEVWRSLKTSDKNLADCRALQWRAEGKRLFRILRRQGHLMTPDQIESLVSGWLGAELGYAEDCRVLAAKGRTAMVMLLANTSVDW